MCKLSRLSLFWGIFCLSASAAPVPFFLDFESPDFSVGSLQSDASLSFSTGGVAVEVINTDAYSGTQSLTLNGLGQMQLGLTDSLSGNVRWVDFYARPVFQSEMDLPESIASLQSAVSAFVNQGGSGEVFVIDGDGNGSGIWVTSEKPLSLNGNLSSGWIRLTYRLDYANKTWDLYVEDTLVLYDLGFLDNEYTALEAFAIRSSDLGTTGFDYFYIGVVNPLFTDADNDGIADVYDVNTGSNDRDQDADGDALSNIEEFRLGTGLQTRDFDGDLMSDGMEKLWALDPILNNSEFFKLQGDTWETGFEPEEGYVFGALDQQLGWSADGVSVTQDDTASVVQAEEKEVFAEHYFGTDPVAKIWFSFRAKLQAGPLPNPDELEGRTAAVFAFSDAQTIQWINAATNDWDAAAVTIDPAVWNEYAVFLDYQNKTWNLYLNGDEIVTNVSFRDPELQALTKFKAAMQKSAGSASAAYMDDLKLYAGNDYDGDGLGDDWELVYSFNPASSDSDANDVDDSDEDNDEDGLINGQEYAQFSSPFLSDTDADGLSDFNENIWGRSAVLADTDLSGLMADGAGGFYWQTLFEQNEGYTVGTLDGQLNWSASGEVTVSADATAHITESEPSEDAYLEHFFAAEGHTAIWFAFSGQFFAGDLPVASSFQDPAAAVFGFSTENTIEVLDASSDAWEAYGINAAAGDLNDYAVYLNYTSKRWELYQNGVLVAADLDFVDTSLQALSRFKLSLENAATDNATSDLDIVQVYSGNNFDADELADDWERQYGLSPATSDTDGDGLSDGEDDNDGDALSNFAEYTFGANPNSPDTDGDSLSDYLEFKWMRDPNTADQDLAPLQSDGSGGLFWQTLFELDEGYTLGALNGQLDWYASDDVVVTEESTAGTSGETDYEAFVERYFATAGQSKIWFSFNGKFHSGAMPENILASDPVAAIFGFSDAQEISVYDSAANTWAPYTTDAVAEDWNTYSVYFDYDQKQWELYQNGQLVAADLDFYDSSLIALSRFKLSLEKVAGSDAASYLDLVQVYAGDDYDGDGLSDAWERYYGLNPATEDSDANSVPDADEDLDGDGDSALAEYNRGGSPLIQDIGIGYYVDQSTGDDLLYNGQSATPNLPNQGDGPKSTISAGLNVALNESTVLVLPGIYDESMLSLNGKDLTLRPSGNVTIY